MVIAVTAMATATSAVRPWAARALFRLRRFDDAGWRARAKAPRCWLRLAQQGIGAGRRPLVGLSVPMMARVCQRESDNGPTGAMVCRRRVTMAGSQQSIGSHRRGRRRWPNRAFCPLVAPFPSLRRSRGT